MSIFNLHENIAKDMCATGEYWLTCQCGVERKISAEHFTEYLRQGWPKHCGYTMSLENRKAAA